MRRDEAERVVALLRDPAHWGADDYSRSCLQRVEELTVVERADGTWAVRLLFQQEPFRMGVETGRLERWTTGEPCSPEELALELQMFGVEEPHGEHFGSSTEATGRRWHID